MMPLTTHPIFLGLFLSASIPLGAQTSVTLSPIVSPTAGQAGVTVVNLTGSNFPLGSILPSNVDVTLAAASGLGGLVSTKASSITTIVGTTRRVSFLLPSSILVSAPTVYQLSVSGSTTTGSLFVSQNRAAITINPAPGILSVNPSSGQPSENKTVTITGVLTNFVQGATQASFGGGIAVGGAAVGALGPVTVTSPTTAIAQVSIAANAAIGPRTVSVQTGVQQVSLPNGFMVGSTPLTVSDFNPKSAPAGTLVTVIGTGLQPNAGTIAQVTLAKQGGGSISAPVASTSPTSLAFTIPAGAATGVLGVAVNNNSANSSQPLAVTASSSFTLTAAPSVADLIQGRSVSYVVSLAGNFSQLAALGVNGVPTGVSASFKPQNITGGQTSILTLTAPPGQSLGAAGLTVTASASVDGLPLSQTAPAQVNVVAPTTSFLGRTVVDDTLETSIAGVTVTMLGKDGSGGSTGCTGTTSSDAAGNFMLRNLPPSCVGRQLVGFDGTTASAPLGKYAGVNLVYTFLSGQVTVSPVLVHLPRIDDRETFFVTQNATVDQTYTFQSIPGLSLTVYRGTTFTLPNGTQPNPFPLVAVQVPVDRLPDSKPPVPTMMLVFIVAFQPANARASQPVAVTYPNTINTAPGANMPLLTLDPTRGAMVPYGTGTVSPNGTQVIPDLDPAFPGHRYGIVNFDWHGQMPPPPAPNQLNPGPPGGGGNSGGGGPNSGPGAGPGGGSGPGGTGSGDGGNGGDTSTGGNGGDSGGSNGGGGGDQGGPGGSCMANAGGHLFPGDDRSQLAWLAHSEAQAGDPVDLSSGIMTLRATDIRIRGGRGSISWGRVFRSLTSIDGPMGIGWYSNYSYGLDTANTNTAAAINLIMPDGNRFLFSRDQTGNLSNSNIPALRGAVLTTSGDNSARLRWKDGTVFQFASYTNFGLSWLVAISDTNSNIVSIARDSNQPLRITRVTDPVGRSLVVAYDGNGRATSVTDPIGRTVQYAYSQFGIETVTNPEGGITRYGYVAAGQLSRITDANGVLQAVNTFDANGRVIAQDRPDGGRLTFSYTLVNPLAATSPVQTTKVGDRLGVEHTYRFTPNGFVTDVTTKEGNQRRYAILPTNEVRSIEEANSKREFSYDSIGNLVSATDELGNTTRYTYDAAFNKVTSITDPLQNVTRFTYDSRGNLLSATDARSNTTSYKYDSFGQMIERTDPLGTKTTFTYDSFGNLIKTTDALGNASNFRYDAISRLVETQNSLGQRTLTAYDRLSRVVSITDARNAVTVSSYDGVGNLLTVTDARGNITRFSYDSMNRLLTRTTALATSDTRVYDQDGNLTRFTDRRGQVSNFTYDGQNRLMGESYADGSLVARSYDSRGRLALVNDSAVGSFSFGYDAAGRLLSSAGPFGTVLYQRDELGRVKSRQVVGQSPVVYAYDAAGNLTNAAMPQAAVTRDYDQRNFVQALMRSNGVSTNVSYDSLGRLLSLSHSRSGGTINSHSYSYDSAGHRISHMTNSAQPLITQPFTALYNSNNQQAQRATIANSFDANGNLLSEAGPTGATTYVWDSRNRLQSISTSAGQTTTFTYDFGGNLLRQVDTGSTSTATKTFLLDDLTNVALITSSDGTQLSIVSGRGLDDHLATINQAGGIEYGLPDALGSIAITVDRSGALMSQFRFEPYGQTIATGSYPFRFTGRTQVANALYYYRARFYNALAGRFISEDPIGLGGGPNLYTYVGGNPMNFADPLGLWRDPSDIYDDATRDARSSGLPGPHNGLQDAYRHCLASCEVSRENTAPIAQCLGWANEVRGDWIHNQQIGERRMDEFNNSVGVTFGRNAQGSQACRTACIGAATSGGLMTYQSGTTPEYWY